MNTDASWWQYAVLGLIVLASLIQVVRKVAPRLATGVQARLSAALGGNGKPLFLRRISTWLQPRAATGNCSDGCGTCGACSSGPQAQGGQTKTVVFHKKPSSGCH